MICPQHDTHIDNCVHERHDVSDNWEIRIPIRCTSEEIVQIAMRCQEQVNTVFFHNGKPWRVGMVPVNIGVQGWDNAGDS